VLQKRIASYEAKEIRFNLLALVGSKIEQLQDEMAGAAGLTPSQVEDVQAQLAQEEEKLAKYARDNERRRFNYFPFVVELMKGLAKEGKLGEVVESGKQARLKAMRDRKAAAGSEGMAMD
jgi:ubiquitin carboxyl-terminal hydrolase L5